MLAGGLDDEPAEEAGRGTVRQRKPGQQAQQRRVARRQPEGVGDRRTACGCPTPAGCRRAPRPGSAPSPVSGRRSSSGPRAARTRASGRTQIGGGRAVLVGAQPARFSPRPPRPARSRAAAPYVRVVGRAEPDDRAVDVRARQRLAPGLAAEREPREVDARVAAPRQPRARAAGASARRRRPSTPRRRCRPRRARRACAITIGRSSRGASTSSSTDPARAIRRRRKNDERVCAATRSISSTTPRICPVAETTGKWRKPRSSISSSTSPPSRSGQHV